MNRITEIIFRKIWINVQKRNHERKSQITMPS